jgi:hypothetical protein
MGKLDWAGCTGVGDDTGEGVWGGSYTKSYVCLINITSRDASFIKIVASSQVFDSSKRVRVVVGINLKQSD